MAKISIIGAGGYVFPLRLIGDMLSHPALRDSTLSLMDIDAGRLELTAQAARDLVAHHGFPTVVEATTSQRESLDGADYVIVTFQVGGLDAYRLDVEIPRRHGIDQTVGDTLGPGGVFRFLRTAPVLESIARDMRELCPKALLINYANPMAMICWYLDRLGISAVGLCHSIQGTSRMLARQIGVPYDEVSYHAAGINHQAWFLRFERDGVDLYPEIRRVMTDRHLRYGAPVVESDEDSLYDGRVERVRTEMLNAFGYFHTESSHHSSEYLPYFRKNAELVERFLPERWDYLEISSSHNEEGHTEQLVAELKEELVPSLEYGATIVNAMETGRPTMIYGNVPNRALIPNLPLGCCVEVPCLVDDNGVQGTAVGPLPTQCAVLTRALVGVQELAVEAALTGDPAHVHHAVAVDPLTSAVLTLDQIRDMVNEMLAAEARWLPESLTAGARAGAGAAG